MQTPRLTKKRAAGGCCSLVAVIVFLVLIASIFGAHGNAAPVPTPTPDLAGYDATATAVDQAAATNVATIEATIDPGLTVQPDIPTPTAQPTHQATPVPTVHATPKPTPTKAPACQAVNGNPWCYNFSPGNLITNPPSNFCSYFNCIASFWNGSGFVNECSDGSYSLSGGHQGDCSHHGGELRPLYSH